MQQISDVMGIEGADTFTRPIYAGNAIATVKSSDEVKIFTVRAASWDAAVEEGAAGEVEAKEAEDVGPGTLPSPTLLPLRTPLTSLLDYQSKPSGSRRSSPSRSDQTSVRPPPSSREVAASSPRSRSIPSSCPLPTSWAPPSEPRGPPSTRGTPTTRSRWGRRARWLPLAFMLPWESRALFSTLRA